VQACNGGVLLESSDIGIGMGIGIVDGGGFVQGLDGIVPPFQSHAGHTGFFGFDAGDLDVEGAEGVVGWLDWRGVEKADEEGFVVAGLDEGSVVGLGLRIGIAGV
jgi:hypothetical protein